MENGSKVGFWTKVENDIQIDKAYGRDRKIMQKQERINQSREFESYIVKR